MLRSRTEELLSGATAALPPKAAIGVGISWASERLRTVQRRALPARSRLTEIAAVRTLVRCLCSVLGCVPWPRATDSRTDRCTVARSNYQ
jgi:hypothetical protein